MINKKQIIGYILEDFNDELGEILESSKSVMEAEYILSNFFTERWKNSKAVTEDELNDMWDTVTALVTATQETAFIKGVEAGSKLIHTLLSGCATSKFLEIMDDKLSRQQSHLVKTCGKAIL